MPVCNEADIIEDVVEEWIQEVMIHLPQGSELLFDDASSDETYEILLNLAQKYPFIKIYHQDRKDGFFKAAIRLYRAASCPLIFFTDSDGQYVPSEFWKLVPYIQDYDVVHGAKSNRQDAFHRVFASFCFNQIAKLLFGYSYPDINSAFRLMHRSVIEQLLSTIKHMPTLINAELLLRSRIEGYSIKALWVEHRKRKYGVSRGLPLKTFAIESFRAYQGLVKIKLEYRRQKSISRYKRVV